MSRVAAVILAGGLGTRLGGVRKATLKVGGARLIDLTLSALAAADTIVVSSGAIPPAALSLPPGIAALPDLHPESRGPLAGLAAASAHFLRGAQPPEIIVCAPVDTPFLPPDFLARAVALLDAGAPAAVARYAGQAYPTTSAWRLSLLADLPRRLLANQGPPSLKHLAQELSAEPLEWENQPSGDPFANVNTLKDLLDLERRLRSSTASRK
ncbi:Molybdopterin-guanine dinucleotide biosynthesis protein MobA [Devosia sp. H5989]|nr:Molybdopterin-guanine dinucleotide biosynthesis protein MobA [Devosia sp. H5989]